MVYADTSFLLSLYVTDSNTERADAWREGSDETFLWTHFHQVEFNTALESRVRRGQTSRIQADKAHDALAQHREIHGIYHLPIVDWDSTWTIASKLARQQAAKHFCRTLDIVHLALAVELGGAEFLSFDERQNTLAHELDLRTLVA